MLAALETRKSSGNIRADWIAIDPRLPSGLMRIFIKLKLTKPFFLLLKERVPVPSKTLSAMLARRNL